MADERGALSFRRGARGFYAGPALWAGCAAAMGALVGASYLARSDHLRPRDPRPTARPRMFFLFAIGLFVLLTFGSDALASQGAAPELVALFFLVLGSLALLWVVQHIGRSENELALVALCAGLVAVLLPQGFFGQLPTGIGMLPVIGYDLLVVLLLFHLWRRYRPLQGPGGVASVGREAVRPSQVP